MISRGLNRDARIPSEVLVVPLDVHRFLPPLLIAAGLVTLLARALVPSLLALVAIALIVGGVWALIQATAHERRTGAALLPIALVLFVAAFGVPGALEAIFDALLIVLGFLLLSLGIFRWTREEPATHP